MGGAWAESRAEEDLGVPREGKSQQSQTAATAMGCSKFLSSSGGDSVRYFQKFCLQQKKYIVLLELE